MRLLLLDKVKYYLLGLSSGYLKLKIWIQMFYLSSFPILSFSLFFIFRILMISLMILTILASFREFIKTFILCRISQYFR